MTIPVEFLVLFLTAVIGGFVGLVKYLISEIKDIKTSLTDINEHFGELNGRMGQSETWQNQHERQNDERQDAIEREHQRLWARLDQRHRV